MNERNILLVFFDYVFIIRMKTNKKKIEKLNIILFFFLNSIYNSTVSPC